MSFLLLQIYFLKKIFFLPPKIIATWQFNLTWWVHLFGELQGIGVGEIGIRWGYGQDQTVLACDELQEHVLDLELDVGGLVTYRHLRKTWQVH